MKLNAEAIIKSKLKKKNVYMGLPMPRPMPPGIPPACGISLADLGLLMVSSTDKMSDAASQAAVNALILIMDGSQTHASKLSAMCSLLMSTPYQHWPNCWKLKFRNSKSHGSILKMTRLHIQFISIQKYSCTPYKFAIKIVKIALRNVETTIWKLRWHFKCRNNFLLVEMTFMVRKLQLKCRNSIAIVKMTF